MTRNSVTHFRIQQDKLACSPKLGFANVQWTWDRKDVTCDNCLKTEIYKKEPEKV